jgi:hypothetical protein
VCRLDYQLLQRRLLVRLGREPVKGTEGVRGGSLTELVTHRDEIEAIAGGISLQDEDGLDPQHLGRGGERNGAPSSSDSLCLKWFPADELPDAGQDAVEAPEDMDGALDLHPR